MKWQLNRILPVSALLLVGFASCKKNDSPFSSSSPATTQASLLMKATNDIYIAGNQQNQEVSDVLGDIVTDSGDSTDCRIVSFDTSRSVFPHVKTINFGTYCRTEDGTVRSGEKIVNMYADWKTAPAGTLLSETTFSNFYIDSVNITGDVKTYIDTSAMTGPFALKIVSNKTLTDSKGNSSTFTSTSYWLQTAGDTTTTKQDNVYQITSSSSGTEVLDGATMVTWTANTDPLHPIIKMGDCSFRSKGGVQIQLTLTGGSVFNEYLDYGDGTCDNIATLAINGGTPQQVTLPLFFWPLSL